MNLYLFKTDYVLLTNGEPLEDLCIIYSAQSVIDLFNTGFSLKQGEQFVKMTDLPLDLQTAYIAEICSR